MSYKFSGTASEDCTVYVINVSDDSTETIESVSTGAYEIVDLSEDNIHIIAIPDDTSKDGVIYHNVTGVYYADTVGLFTTYTEVDPNGDITINSDTLITIDTMRRDVVAGVYKDYGAGRFTGDFTFQWHWICSASNGSNANSSIFALSEGYYLTKKDREDANDGLDISYRVGGGITLIDFQNDDTDSYSIVSGPPKERWFTLTRSGTTVQLFVYLNSARTSLQDTMTISQSSAHTYRYLYPATSAELGTYPTSTINYTISDLVKI